MRRDYTMLVYFMVQDNMQYDTFIQLVDAYRERWHESYLAETLVQLVHGNRVGNLDDYVEGMMGYEKDVEKKKNEDYYKQYSNMAKNVIKKAVGVRDDAFYFLFDNVRTSGRKILRRVNLDPQHIEIPQELIDLAVRMPDALHVSQHTMYQEIKE